MSASSRTITGTFLLVSLVILAGLPAIAAPETARDKAGAPAWKNIPEDRDAWRREPFKKTAVPDGSAAKSAAIGQKKAIKHLKPFDESTDIVIQGIMKIDNRHYAIINGRTFKAGERVEGRTIKDIGRYSVVLQDETGLQTYDIYQGRIDRGK